MDKAKDSAVRAIIRALVISVAAIFISQPFVYPAIEAQMNGSDVFSRVVITQATLAVLIGLAPLVFKRALFRSTTAPWLVVAFSSIPLLLVLYPLSQAFLGYIPLHARS